MVVTADTFISNTSTLLLLFYETKRMAKDLTAFLFVFCFGFFMLLV